MLAAMKTSDNQAVVERANLFETIIHFSTRLVPRLDRVANLVSFPHEKDRVGSFHPRPSGSWAAEIDSATS